MLYQQTVAIKTNMIQSLQALKRIVSFVTIFQTSSNQGNSKTTIQIKKLHLPNAICEAELLQCGSLSCNLKENYENWSFTVERYPCINNKF